MSFFNEGFSKILKGLDNHCIEQYKHLVDDINSIDLSGLDDQDIKSISSGLIKQAGEGMSLDGLLARAFAVVKEAAGRMLGIRAHDMQLLAGIAMHYGNLVEMQTGEGKTLAAVFPAYLNALTGKGVHVLTFNDYLAQRDAEWMGVIYRYLGLSVGFIKEGMNANDRKKSYASDITYLTAKEAGFDYLRDCLCYEKDHIVHRNYNFAIVDEADSILIDEARIPLVIAGNSELHEDNAYKAAEAVRNLMQKVDYDTDHYVRNAYLTEMGLVKVETCLNCGNLYAAENIELLTLVNSALHAKVLLKRDVDYIIRDGRVELIDEFTGRIAEKRHWPEGLQAAIEAKEGLEIQSKGRILGSITLQNYLKYYSKICGMTGTAAISAEEFRGFYNLNVVEIPTNRPCVRIDHPDVVFTHKEAKYKALVKEIVSVHSTGRPILIGTASVGESDLLAGMLKNTGIECKVLNAKNDEEEARIIARAGELGAVTVSTNMAGRGTDIRLGGVKEWDRVKVAELGGLYVIGTNRHESRRIDNQLQGRAGRQGDPGSSRFFISLEDDLIKRFGIEKVLPQGLRGVKQDEPLEKASVNQRIAHIQRVVEGQNLDTRRTLWKYSNIMDEQRRIVQEKRQNILMDCTNQYLLSGRSSERYKLLLSVVGKDNIEYIEKHITLFQIDRCWEEHLDYVAYIREGIHLVSIAGQSPLDEFHKAVIKSFDEFWRKVEDEIVKTFDAMEITEKGVDMDKAGIKGPSSTWTYLVTDDYFLNNLGAQLISSGNAGFAAAAILTSWPMLIWALIYDRFFKARNRKI